jgi:signal transduction histidine kinase
MEVKGIKAKLSAAFILQAAVISFATILGVYASAIVMEELLVKQTLRQEATFFWEKKSTQADFLPPETRNLRTWFAPVGEVPDDLPEVFRDTTEGFTEHASMPGKLLHVSTQGDQRIWLLFNKSGVSELALWFGLVPLAGVLLALYLSTWLLYRLSNRAVSPLVWLSRHVEAVDPKDPDSSHLSDLNLDDMPGEPNGEVIALADALKAYESRHQAFGERERNFTRDASHELRSPLTVIRAAAEILLGSDLDDFSRRSAEKILKSSRDMEELTSAFLLLARESDTGLTTSDIDVNDFLNDEAERVEALLSGKPVSLTVKTRCHLRVHTARQVLSVMVGNLLRNACSYTDEGRVEVIIDDGSIAVEDTGEGISDEMLDKIFDPYYRGQRSERGGHGVGLTIVKRLSDRYNWGLEIESRLGVGTRVCIHFPPQDVLSCTNCEEQHTPLNNAG